MADRVVLTALQGLKIDFSESVNQADMAVDLVAQIASQNVPDAIDNAHAVVPPPEEGLFPADGWLRRVSGESVLLFGGGRALQLEVAHPLVAAGVANHSSFRVFDLDTVNDH